ncbi:MAG: Hydroxymethylpyrimidine ABC transporter, transmembrane component, partial [uncultured Pseudonocardia sp.]
DGPRPGGGAGRRAVRGPPDPAGPGPAGPGPAPRPRRPAGARAAPRRGDRHPGARPRRARRRLGDRRPHRADRPVLPQHALRHLGDRDRRGDRGQCPVRHGLHVLLDHPRLPARHAGRRRDRPVVLVVAALRDGRRAVRDRVRGDAEAGAGPDRRAGARHRHLVEGRDGDSTGDRGAGAQRLRRCEGRRPRPDPDAGLPRREPVAGLHQGRGADGPAVDRVGPARDHRPGARRRDRRRVHRLHAGHRPDDPVRRHHVRDRADLGRHRHPRGPVDAALRRGRRGRAPLPVLPARHPL